MKPRTVVVLGMGRSGTSTTADVLRRLGIYWGPEELMMGPQPDNALGFLEFIPLYEINVSLLARLGGDWHRPPILPMGWEKSPDLDDLRKKAGATIEKYFSGVVWGFKDPRCCLTLPFWKTVIPNPIECVIPIRNPLEVAASLHRREQLPISRGLALWTAYVAWAWTASEGLRRLVVSYGRLLESPEPEIFRLIDFLGLASSADLVENAALWILGDLKHQHSSLAELLSNPDVPRVTKEMYVALRKMSEGGPESVSRLIPEAMEFANSVVPCPASP